ncbi:Piso0_002416 [Millerozyma farinosa CBS 7064]|uniref:Piso0_002416 protein n=1 Tax=Pichia sorbitophila (strain ATCC MYA-4447 / BCRC 22081 / CBS 7064 / NBRC 10061 / NRRL Y-12695) TaxID=559304 RepID=G8YCJ7_PICSO|nr:Piso0_002416 [Millerozyma farinosa CBS 7064]
MPSRNSVNKPKDKILRNSHSAAIGKKRASRQKSAPKTRSSTFRYNENSNVKPSPTESNSLALYSGRPIDATGGITTKSLSKKRAKKISRNQKYIAQRNEQLGIDLKAKEESMEVEDENPAENEDSSKSSSVDAVRKALWSVVKDTTAGVLQIAAEHGEGTTLGIQAF